MKKYILVINKNTQNHQVLISLLNQLQQTFKCIYAENATQALGLLKYIKPELVLIDVTHEHMHQLESIHLVKAKQQLNKKPLIFYAFINKDMFFKQPGSMQQKITANSNMQALAEGFLQYANAV